MQCNALSILRSLCCINEYPPCENEGARKPLVNVCILRICMRAFGNLDSILNRAGWRSYDTLHMLYVCAGAYVFMPAVLRAASILAPGLPHHAVGLTVCSGSIITFQFLGNSAGKGLLRLGIRKAASPQPCGSSRMHTYMVLVHCSHEVSHSAVLPKLMALQADTLLHKTRSQFNRQLKLDSSNWTRFHPCDRWMCIPYRNSAQPRNLSICQVSTYSCSPAGYMK